MTINPTTGGNDTILTGNGQNVILGGFGNDTITSGDGDDIILGDNGHVTLAIGGEGDAPENKWNDLWNTYLAVVCTTDPTAGGNDTIIGGDGRNVILGGPGTDQITAGAGDNAIVAGNGKVVVSAEVEDDQWHGYNHTMSGRIDTEVFVTDPSNGNGSTVTVGNGHNIIFSGTNKDIIKVGDEGYDLIVGVDSRVIRINDGDVNVIHQAAHGPDVMEVDMTEDWVRTMGPTGARVDVHNGIFVDVHEHFDDSYCEGVAGLLAIVAPPSGYGWKLDTTATGDGLYRGPKSQWSVLTREADENLGLRSDFGTDGPAGDTIPPPHVTPPAAKDIITINMASTIVKSHGGNGLSWGEAPQWISDFVTNFGSGSNPNGGFKINPGLWNP
jgi:Ca2+-binding RTX toxin-like protein